MPIKKHKESKNLDQCDGFTVVLAVVFASLLFVSSAAEQKKKINKKKKSFRRGVSLLNGWEGICIG